MSEQPMPEAPAPDAPDPDPDPRPKPTETVEFWKQKAREQEKRAKDNAEAAKRLTALEAANLSEVERAQRVAAEAQERLSSYERTVMRQKVALEKGVPAALVGRLMGDTEDEITEDADALLALINAPTSPKPDPSQGARGGTSPGTPQQDFAQFLQRTR